MSKTIKPRRKITPLLIDEILKNTTNPVLIWKLKNREYVLEYNKNYNKKYYLNNKKNFSYNNDKIFCNICNCNYFHSHKSRHFKTKKHINNSNSPVEC